MTIEDPFIPTMPGQKRSGFTDQRRVVAVVVVVVVVTIVLL